MPYRKLPFVINEVYHVFNRSIARQPIFGIQRNYWRFLDVISYYRFANLPLRFSHFNRLTLNKKDSFLKSHIEKSVPTLEILAYCLMPNHFHLLLKPRTLNAISIFMRKIQNSYSKYYNTKYQRNGSLFQFMFKAVRIETDEQLIHVSRYIHLNPVTSYLMEMGELEKYRWSSYSTYIAEAGIPNIVNTTLVLSHFKSKDDYKKFVWDQASYQRELENIKHLTLDYP